MRPLTRALRQPHRQHHIAARQAGEHHRQRAAVISPLPRIGARWGSKVIRLRQNRRTRWLGGRRTSGRHRGGQLRVPIGAQVPIQGADQPVGFPHRRGLGVRPRSTGNAGELPPRADPRRPVPTPRRIGEQMPIDGFPHLIGHMQPDRFGQVITHPAAGLNMVLGRGLDALAGQPQPLPQPFRIGLALTVGRPIRSATMRSVALQRSPQPKHRHPMPFQALTHHWVADVEFQPDHRDRPVVFEVRGLRLAPPPRHHHVTADNGRDVGGHGCHSDHETITHRQPAPTDIETWCRSPPDKCISSASSPDTAYRHTLEDPVRLLVPTHLRTNLTTRALAALFGTR